MQNTQNVSNNLTKNKVKNYLEETPIKNLTPTDQRLREWDMTKKRFGQIRNNTGQELSYSEAIKITEWLRELYFPKLQPYELFEYKDELIPVSHE